MMTVVVCVTGQGGLVVIAALHAHVDVRGAGFCAALHYPSISSGTHVTYR